MVRALLRGLVIVLLAACARCEESAGLEEQSAPEAEVEAGDNTTGIAAASGGIGVLFLLLVGICVVRVFGSRNNVAMREAEVRLASASNSGGNPPPRDSTDMSGELQDTPPMTQSAAQRAKSMIETLQRVEEGVLYIGYKRGGHRPGAKTTSASTTIRWSRAKLPELVGDDGEAEEDKTCCVCFERLSDVQLLPCRHQQFCRDCIVDSTCRWCYNDHLECPICRQPIESILFDSDLFPAVPDGTPLASAVIDVSVTAPTSPELGPHFLRDGLTDGDANERYTDLSPLGAHYRAFSGGFPGGGDDPSIEDIPDYTNFSGRSTDYATEDMHTDIPPSPDITVVVVPEGGRPPSLPSPSGAPPIPTGAPSPPSGAAGKNGSNPEAPPEGLGAAETPAASPRAAGTGTDGKASPLGHASPALHAVEAVGAPPARPQSPGPASSLPPLSAPLSAPRVWMAQNSPVQRGDAGLSSSLVFSSGSPAVAMHPPASPVAIFSELEADAPSPQAGSTPLAQPLALQCTALPPTMRVPPAAPLASALASATLQSASTPERATTRGPHEAPSTPHAQPATSTPHAAPHGSSGDREAPSPRLGRGRGWGRS